MAQHAATAKHAPSSIHNNLSNKKGLRQAGYIFMVINTVFLAFAIIPMIWCIQMTMTAKKKIKNLNESAICLVIFTFLFVSFIGVILLLCGESAK
ncbi:hypothetical protein P344_06580 [Spiroplasma mirum ATCC 29335]|uniref:Uncharacterized protein n=1 Tax=Spiroplasma mirum ATCC 29335 TaxID=838561 RepID=W0GS55_9MOLU|nr:MULTISPECIES: hypothetical protein [Spiroplasma]AHF61474.1 hypothetical protein SMM_1105 [Spiroplasma mirum ATCC 29335]AHI58617.1 hypothetical protein P344_06580 [Spiroplasma mirum ATCC 29335]AKM53516.1 hypothetical protein SATRI_v1c11750 [Spiroplasma atrichopogonis]